MSTIRNPDLSRMPEKRLIQEADYLYLQIERRVSDLKHNSWLVRYRVVPTVPTWKLTEDYNLLTERLQMVMDELQFRQIP